MALLRPITIKELPPEEWERLKGLPVATLGLPDPATCRVVIAETDEGRIVGTWCLVFAPFLEGMWVDEEYRNRSTAGWRLVKFMKGLLAKWKAPNVYTAVETKEVQGFAERVGFNALPATLMKLEIPIK